MDNHTIAELTEPERLTLYVYSVLLLVVGTVGNSLLLATVLFKKLRKPTLEVNTIQCPAIARTVQKVHPAHTGSTADKLLLLLTFADLVCLWVLVLRYSLTLSAYGDVRLQNKFACKFHTFLSMVCSNLSIALLCIFSVHRAISIRWPLASYTWLSKRKLNACLFGAFVFILLKHAPALFIFSLVDLDVGVKCDIRPDTDTLGKAYYYLEFSTHCVLGYPILIVSNILLYVFLKRTLKRGITSMSGTSNRSTDTVTQSATTTGISIARVLLFFSWIQLITSVPFLIFIESSDQFGWDIIPDNRKLFVYFALLLAMLTNNGINFFIMIGISTKFRGDVRSLLVHFRELCAHTCHKA
ncbi:uncharacterized protein DEA37_0002524 [Paragonimus westermani]|uniref:G-protein coupled receptors family 1 profile domain-containing protein n=1 Tax=Paragonimus westermani TaxID=34504 RepID=A0A5J4NZI2_9TREM|nr:uncharacterized protein DEA37_0002524 [Paragonimus westermani]